jgi:hypothetical protein
MTQESRDDKRMDELQLAFSSPRGIPSNTLVHAEIFASFRHSRNCSACGVHPESQKVFFADSGELSLSLLFAVLYEALKGCLGDYP